MIENKKQRLSPNSDRVGLESLLKERAAVRKKYQRKERKSIQFEVVRGQELLVQVPLPMAEVWASCSAVEELTGQPGCRSCARSWRTKSRVE